MISVLREHRNSSVLSVVPLEPLEPWKTIFTFSETDLLS
jgi:hypothetical protein